MSGNKLFDIKLLVFVSNPTKIAYNPKNVRIYCLKLNNDSININQKKELQRQFNPLQF
jgi:hypothetical protein